MARLDLARFAAAIALLGYLLIARAVLNLYPFSIFNMYSSEPLASASRIVARDPDGAVFEVDEYTRWRCPAAPDIAPTACPASWPFYYIPYLDREAAAHIAGHTADDHHATPVTVVRRIFRLSDEPGPPVIEDCVLRECHAVRR